MCPHAWRLPFSLTTELGVVNLTDYPCFKFGYDRTKILNDSVYKIQKFVEKLKSIDGCSLALIMFDVARKLAITIAIY